MKKNLSLISLAVIGLLSFAFYSAKQTENRHTSTSRLPREASFGTSSSPLNGAWELYSTESEGQPTSPEFLSTHPNPGNRVAAIEKKNNELGCSGKLQYQTEYARIKGLLR